MSAAAATGHALATDVAEWLVRTGTAFRDAHEIAGRLVRYCDERDLELWELDDDGLASVDARLTPEVRTVLSVRGSLTARSTHGGTAPARVRRAAGGAGRRRARARGVGDR